MEKKIIKYISAFTLILTFSLIWGSCAATQEFSGGDRSVRDWPIFRGTPSLCGYTDCALSDAPKLLWSISTKTRTVASPIVFNSVVYTLSRAGELRGYTMDGDLCAYLNLDTPVEASFIASDTILYIGRIDGFVTALSIKKLMSRSHSSDKGVSENKGKGMDESVVLWQYETLGQISGSPNLVGDNLLVGSYDNSMYTFKALTGRKTGQFETGYYINGTAAVWHCYMMFGGCDAWVRVVDTGTGVITDSLELDTYVPASPAILDGTACAADYNGNVYEMQLQGGKIVSHEKLFSTDADNAEQDGGVVSMPTLTDDAVYILLGDRHICCIDRASHEMRWRKMLRGQTGECSPLVAQDKVLVCTKDGHVSMLDSANGAELWHYEAGEQIIASPAIIGDRFFILTSRGTLLCFG